MSPLSPHSLHPSLLWWFCGCHSSYFSSINHSSQFTGWWGAGGGGGMEEKYLCGQNRFFRFLTFKTGVPNPQAMDHYQLGAGLHSRRWAEGQQASKASSAACHRSPWLTLPPDPPPALSVEKFSSMKPVPGAKKVGDRWFKTLHVDGLMEGKCHLRVLKRIPSRSIFPHKKHKPELIVTCLTLVRLLAIGMN